MSPFIYIYTYITRYLLKFSRPVVKSEIFKFYDIGPIYIYKLLILLTTVFSPSFSSPSQRGLTGRGLGGAVGRVNLCSWTLTLVLKSGKSGLDEDADRAEHRVRRNSWADRVVVSDRSRAIVEWSDLEKS